MLSKNMWHFYPPKPENNSLFLVFIFQITKLKIDHNPFAKGFREEGTHAKRWLHSWRWRLIYDDERQEWMIACVIQRGFKWGSPFFFSFQFADSVLTRVNPVQRIQPRNWEPIQRRIQNTKPVQVWIRAPWSIVSKSSAAFSGLRAVSALCLASVNMDVPFLLDRLPAPAVRSPERGWWGTPEAQAGSKPPGWTHVPLGLRAGPHPQPARGRPHGLQQLWAVSAWSGHPPTLQV